MIRCIALGHLFVFNDQSGTLLLAPPPRLDGFRCAWHCSRDCDGKLRCGANHCHSHLEAEPQACKYAGSSRP